MVIIGIIVGVVVLMVLVALHELGHAVVARRNGVEVKEFAIGFPPRAKAWKPARSFLGKNVTYSLNWLPLGGFVRMKGEHDAATGVGTYGAAGYWAKTRILLAGVAVNWVVAAVLLSVVALIGLPKLVPHQVVLPFDTQLQRSAVTVARVVPDSPAAQAGLRTGDEVVSLNGAAMITSDQLTAAAKERAGQSVNLVYRRDGREQQAIVMIADAERAQRTRYLGVGLQQSETIRATWSAPLLGVATTAQLTVESLKGVGDILAKMVNGIIGQVIGSAEQKQAASADLKSVSDNVAGPVGILGVLFPAVVTGGVVPVLLLAAIISLTLAVMNILPIPALDGGRWTVMTLFRLVKKPLTKEREETIQAVGFLTLMTLAVLVTWSDIAKLW
ncbi:MAG: M50 family metallopeptidase [Candidatus Saccharibacteria bacterium]|nr:M50 family metallopeptidase [Candidatus Saccharibacteria bacterium]